MLTTLIFKIALLPEGNNLSQAKSKGSGASTKEKSIFWATEKR
jgi:hypothetical protein